jgi:hypothetical protein
MGVRRYSAMGITAHGYLMGLNDTDLSVLVKDAEGIAFCLEYYSNGLKTERYNISKRREKL